MKIKELTCINCPLGCALTVTLDGEKVIKVEGNTCPKGKTYGEKEVTNPTRILTSSVEVIGGKLPVVSVKTASDIPKNKIKECAAGTGKNRRYCFRKYRGYGYCIDCYKKCRKKVICCKRRNKCWIIPRKVQIN